MIKKLQIDKFDCIPCPVVLFGCELRIPESAFTLIDGSDSLTVGNDGPDVINIPLRDVYEKALADQYSALSVSIVLADEHAIQRIYYIRLESAELAIIKPLCINVPCY